MQHITTGLSKVTIREPIPQGRGGRVSSQEHRQSLEISEEFTGLPKDTDRYDLLKLVKRAGKGAGFSSRMVELLDYYMAFTRDNDWEEGSRPIVYQSLSRTALDLGVSERQVQRVEQELFDAGALTWNDSGNHRRYGQRDQKTGRILYAFGVDLTPLASLKELLEQKLAAKEARDDAWMETKRQISWYRAQVRAVLAEQLQNPAADAGAIAELQKEYDAIAVQIRAHMDLEALNSLLAKHKELHSRTLELVEQVSGHDNDSTKTQKMSPTSDERVTHYNLTNQELTDKSGTGSSRANIGFRESVTRPVAGELIQPEQGEKEQKDSNGAGDSTPESSHSDAITAAGLSHITLKQALNAASPRLRDFLPLNTGACTWSDMIEAAWRLRPELHISQKSWAEACQILGRTGAAVCMILTDQATLREKDRVMKPGAYFHAMINKAKSGELHLHKSIFGILKREEI